jgi:hypothetical protein
MTRLNDWPTRLSDYVLRVAREPFKYGRLDCGLFVAGAIDALVGVDVVAELRGQYSTRREAFDVIASHCGRRSMEAIAAHLAERNGFPETPVAFAQCGDPVVLRRGASSSLGIVAMHGTELLTPYKDGLLRLPLSHATRAYHI